MAQKYEIDLTKNSLVVVATKRSQRPKGVQKQGCPFCPGNESMTPPTITAFPGKGKWRTRVFENAFPFLDSHAVFKEIPGIAAGYHWVITETDKHGKYLQDFDAKQLKLLADAYAFVYRALENKKGVKSVFLFRNHGAKAGASIEHEHAQVAAFPFVYPVLKSEMEFYEARRKETRACFYCGLLKKKSLVLFENACFTAVVPEFARFNCEVWIIPKRHAARFGDLSEKEGLEFVKALKEAARRIQKFVPDYNVAFHSAPQGRDFHFHAECYPRRAIWAGAELGAGVVINSKDAKESKKILR